MSEHMHQQESWTETRNSGHPQPMSGRLGNHGRSIVEATVKRDVIPRLVAMSWLAATAAVDTSPSITEATLRKVIDLCLEPQGHAVETFVTSLHRAGVAAGVIYESLLTPAARQLGVMWEDDTCSLADVTIGVLRLQNAQRSLAASPLDHAAPPLGAPRALLMAVPGEQHTFGLSIVLDYFARAGWEASMGPAGSRAQALALIKRERTELVGLSFACDDRVPDAAALIVAIRAASRNPHLIIMVGGPPFVADPSLAASMGADATATDGQQAVVRANELLHISDQHRSAGRR